MHKGLLFVAFLLVAVQARPEKYASADELKNYIQKLEFRMVFAIDQFKRQMDGLIIRKEEEAQKSRGDKAAQCVIAIGRKARGEMDVDMQIMDEMVEECRQFLAYLDVTKLTDVELWKLGQQFGAFENGSGKILEGVSVKLKDLVDNFVKDAEKC